jgi:hypothetical protein
MLQVNNRGLSQPHAQVDSLLQLGPSNLPVQTAPTSSSPPSLLVPALLIALTAGVWLWPDIPLAARVVLWVYGLALVAWVPPWWPREWFPRTGSMTY